MTDQYRIYLVENQKDSHIHWMIPPTILKFDNKQEAIDKYYEIQDQIDLNKYHLLLFKFDDSGYVSTIKC